MSVVRRGMRGMNRFLVAAFAVAALVGCQCGPGKYCTTAADCAAGETCEAGACLGPDAGGGSGGGGGGGIGGGGGAQGGGLGGGGGGTGGGAPTCSPACAVWEACQGTTCVATVSLDWVTPDAGTRARPGVSMTLVVRADGGAPNTIPWRISSGGTGSGTLTAATGGVHQDPGFLTPNTALDTTLTLVAGWEDGGPTTQTQFVVDPTNPALTVTIETPPTRAGTHWNVSGTNPWRRDEKPYVAVMSTEALGSAQLTLATSTTGVTPVARNLCTAAQGLGACATAGDCACFQVDLSQPALPGIGGTFEVAASALDLAGNQGGPVDAGVGVSRKRWEVSLSSSADLRASPVLDERGVLFVGTRESATNGRIHGLRPDGTEPFTSTLVGAVESLAYGRDLGQGYVYFAANNGNGRLGAVFVSDGGAPSGFPAACISGSTMTYSGIALIQATASNMGVVGVVNSQGNNPGRLCMYSGTFSSDVQNASPLADGGVGYLDAPAVGTNDITSAANVVFANGNVYFPTVGGAVRYYAYNTGGTWPSTTPGAGNVYNLTGAPPPSATISGLAFQSGTSALYASGSSDSSFDGLYRVLTGSSTIARASTNSNVGMPTVRNATEAVVATAANSLHTVTTYGVAMPAGSATGDFVSSAPVIGAGGLTYTVSRLGNLSVSNAPTNRLWQAQPFSAAATVYASPTLDCVRNPTGTFVSGARVGVLYAVATDGRVAAVIVDSAKLDTGAPWPKYQRDAANSGNASLGLPLNDGCQ